MIMKIYHNCRSLMRRTSENALLAGRHGRAVSATVNTFLIRLWKEPRENSRWRPIYRGTVSNLRGTHLGSFSSAAELHEILAGNVDRAAPRQNDDRCGGYNGQKEDE
jgi:hypothetical protein